MDESHRRLEDFYLEHRQQLFTCALAVTRCPDRAEDAIHEVFQRLFRLPRLPKCLKSYVFRSVRNAAIDSLRRTNHRDAPLDESIFDSGSDPRAIAADNEFRLRVEEALSLLSDDERGSVIQHLYGELTFREIAEIRDAPIGTVTSWYRRGIEKLRDHLEN